MPRTFALRREILKRFAVVALLSAALALWVYRSLTGVIRDNAWVAHTHEVLTEIEHTVSLLRDAEASQWAYLLSGREPDLAPYRLAADQLGPQIDRLVWLTRDNRSQGSRLARLRQLAAQRMALLHDRIDLRGRRGPGAVLGSASVEPGRQLMERLRSLVAEMSAEERTLLERRRSLADSSASFTMFLVGVGLLSNLTILGFVFGMVSREVRRRDLLEVQLSEANARLEGQASTDPLTGLANRRRAGEVLETAVACAARQGTPLSVILADVDYFKSFNDTYGHPAGDDVLTTVAAVLRGVVRGCDLVARHGGEEFLIVAPGADVSGATALAERLRQSVAEAPWPARTITISLGVATLAAGSRDASELVANADAALYRSKHSGRDRVTHYDLAPPALWVATACE
jgi:diguanylate cyclase (GGDEF)-like protein